MSKLVSIFWKVRKFSNENCLKVLSYSIVYPYIINCASIWGGGCKTTLNPISSICGVRSRKDFIFRESKLLRFSDIISFVTCKDVHRSLNIPSQNTSPTVSMTDVRGKLLISSHLKLN